jgi:hypothetical protein
MRTVHQTETVSLQSTVMSVTKSHIALGHPESSISSLILTFPVDSATLGISAPLSLSNSYLRSIQHPALLLNLTGKSRFWACPSV